MLESSTPQDVTPKDDESKAEEINLEIQKIMNQAFQCINLFNEIRKGLRWGSLTDDQRQWARNAGERCRVASSFIDSAKKYRLNANRSNVKNIKLLETALNLVEQALNQVEKLEEEYKVVFNIT